jgi:thiol:disulfide interchange protein DsbD
MDISWAFDIIVSAVNVNVMGVNMHELLNILESSLQAGSLLAYPAVFVGGVLASLTPCVYPLIPVTVAFIGSRSETSMGKRFALSLVYVIGIAVTYALLGSSAALTGKLFGQVATHPLTNFVVGNILLLMALSLFELFEIPVPRFLKRSAGSRPVGIAGAFMVGVTAGLVMSPCTAPVFGALLLFVASRHNVIFGMSLMFTFAMGIGAILVAIGTFTGLIARLPRSGRWLVLIRKAFGCLMLLAGEYYLIQVGRLLE